MKLVMIITGLSTGGAELMLLNLLKHIDRGRFSPLDAHAYCRTEAPRATGLRFDHISISGSRSGFRKSEDSIQKNRCPVKEAWHA